MYHWHRQDNLTNHIQYLYNVENVIIKQDKKNDTERVSAKTKKKK